MADPNESTPMANSTPAQQDWYKKYGDLTFNKDHKKPIEAWQRGIITNQLCHSQLSEKYDLFDTILNTFSLTLTALSSSAMFVVSVKPQVDAASFGGMWSKNLVSYVAGIIAVVSTILQAVHMALQHVILAEKHRQATIALTKLRFHLEHIVGDNVEEDTGNLNYYSDLNGWAREYKDALESAPLIPQNYFEVVRQKYVENSLQFQKLDQTKSTPMANLTPAQQDWYKYEDLTSNKDHKKPIEAWQRGIITNQLCHSQLAEKYDLFDTILNTFSLTLTALSSSAIFVSVNPQVDAAFGGMWSKNLVSYVAGIISVVSTILQAVHMALQHVILAEQHRQATIALTKLRFHLELIVGDNVKDTGNLNYSDLNRWAREYKDALESAPVIPQNYFEAACEKYEEKYSLQFAPPAVSSV